MNDGIKHMQGKHYILSVKCSKIAIVGKLLPKVILIQEYTYNHYSIAHKGRQLISHHNNCATTGLIYHTLSSNDIKHLWGLYISN